MSDHDGAMHVLRNRIVGVRANLDVLSRAGEQMARERVESEEAIRAECELQCCRMVDPTRGKSSSRLHVLDDLRRESLESGAQPGGDMVQATTVVVGTPFLMLKN
jgi:hypothetical protein